MKFSTLAAICRYLDCTPGDILDYEISDADIHAAEADVKSGIGGVRNMTNVLCQDKDERPLAHW